MVKKIISMLLICTLFIAYQPFPDYAEAKTDLVPMVTAGYNFSAVLKSDGTVWSFGLNDSGQAGSGRLSYQSDPVRVLGLSNVIDIDSADDYTLALKKDGTVWGWGNNYEHGLGSGKPMFCRYAAQISDISGIKDIAAGNAVSLFVTTDGTVEYIMWQNNQASAPVLLTQLIDITAIACKNSTAMALDKNGNVFVWQWDYSLDNDGVVMTEPVKADITDVKSIAMGAYHCMALKKDGSVWLWGMNNHGEIGDGSRVWCNTPKKLDNVTGAVVIAAGAYDSMAVLSDGTYLAWGNNEDGQLGDNTLDSALTPVTIDRLKGTVCMDGGYEHTIALLDNGNVMVMGNNRDNLLGIDDGVDKLTPCKVMNVNDKTDMSLYKNIIYPDGNLVDWKKTKPIATAAEPSNGEKSVGIQAIYAKTDQENLYLAASLTGEIPIQVSFGLDVNDDKKTDYTVDFKNGSYAHAYLSETGKKSYKEVYGAYGDVVEIIIPLSQLGSPTAIHVSAVYGADKEKYGVNTELNAWYPVKSNR